MAKVTGPKKELIMTKEVPTSSPPLERTRVRAAVYARYSSDMQSEASADDQIARIQYRLAQGQVRSQKYIGHPIELDPLWTLKDEAQSGRLAGRENYEKILQGVRSKSFNLLIVDDLSRLTRSLGSLLGLYEMLKWYEVELISICDAISSEDVSAKTFFTVKGMVNDFSNDIHAERVIRGMEMRVLKGLSCGDYPYGYDSNPTKLENAKGRPFPSHFKITVNEAEGQVLRRIFQMYQGGLGFMRIARALNEEKVPSPGALYAKLGSKPVWSARSVQHILRNEKYIGVWKWKKTKVGVHPETKLKVAKERPTTEWVSHLAGNEIREDLRIIDQDIWCSVQKQLDENMRSPYVLRNKSRWGDKSKVMPEHPFSGVMECGLCAANFMLLGGKKGGYYGCIGARKGVCTNRQLIPIDRIEKAIIGLVREKLGDSEMLEQAATRYNKTVKAKLSSSPKRLKEIDQELDMVEGELIKLIDFLISGNASETVNYAIKEREARKARLLAEGSSLKKSTGKVTELSTKDIEARLGLLWETVSANPTKCFPIIRSFFPKKIRLLPNGKALNGQSLYSMKGQAFYNDILGTPFERSTEKTKGEAMNSLPLGFSSRNPSRESESLGFSRLENGVTKGT